MKIEELLSMEIKTRKDALMIMRTLSEYRSKAEKEKRSEAFCFLNFGTVISPRLISYNKVDTSPSQSIGDCYEVTYKESFIGYTAEYENGWRFSVTLEDLPATDLVDKMRRKVVARYIEEYLK
ncbi:hypothetical protein bcgnr5372_38200 [Bacillus luti]|nr:hypothetical protein [Bacillus cereus]HDR8327205.1 hypothetical protein [Bacillus cereus]HDR8336395.1 hypothetical protein [Bacillus cereus]